MATYICNEYMQQPKNNIIAFLLFVGLVLSCALLLFSLYPTDELFLAINSIHTSWLDVLMPYITILGDGTTAIVLGIILLLIIKDKRLGIGILLAYALSGITVQLLKRMVFTNHQRPWVQYQLSPDLHTVMGYQLYSNNSFPSGHTTTAFVVAGLLILIYNKSWLNALLAVLAVAVAWSRIYLAQHYFTDVFAGFVLGCLFAFIVFYGLYIHQNRFANYLRYFKRKQKS